MRQINGQFKKVFRTQAGNKFDGELGDTLSNSDTDSRSYRLLTVSSGAVASTGDVVSSGDIEFLIALNTSLSKTKKFRAYEITHKLPWMRTEDKVDFVTGLPRDAFTVTLNPGLPVVIAHGTIVENMSMEADRYEVLTGADVKVGDRLGSMLVHTLQDFLGLKLLVVS